MERQRQVQESGPGKWSRVALRPLNLCRNDPELPRLCNEGFEFLPKKKNGWIQEVFILGEMQKKKASSFVY